MSIELKNVSLSFGEHIIIDQAQIKIEAGEKLVLIGPSGQGKTVLLKIMAGLIPPLSGHVFVNGQSLLTSSKKDRMSLNKKMGMLFQKNALFDSLTCGENIAFPLREVTDHLENTIQEKVQFYLHAVGLEHAEHLFPDEISGGMQKRLGIARALALDPEIIFYDDPTAGLDPITSKKIIELILDLQKKNNTTVVAITNDMNRAYQLADRIAMIANKKLFITGNKKQTLECQEPQVYRFVRGLPNE